MSSSVPDFDAVASGISANTLRVMLPLWMNNWAANLQKARGGDSLDKIYQKPASNKVLIVGRGPSLRKYHHLDLLAKRSFPGHVIASDGAVPLLASKGIIPYLCMTVDGSPLIAKWFTGLGPIGNKLKAILPITVNPKTVSAVQDAGAHIYWYIPELDAEPFKGITEMLQLQTYSPANPTGVSKANGAGNAGLASIVLAISILRAKEIVLVGMDGGYPPDTPIEECHYHTSLLRTAGYSEAQAAKLYRVYYQPFLKYCVVDPVFELYRRTFLGLAKSATAQGVKIINATEGGCLWDENVGMVKFEDYLLGKSAEQPYVPGVRLTSEQFARLSIITA